jgi:hypothetical protein
MLTLLVAHERLENESTMTLLGEQCKIDSLFQMESFDLDLTVKNKRD